MKPILIISDNDLLMAGIERLLRKTADFAIQKIVSYDENEIIRHMQEHATEFVIVDGSYEKSGALQLSSLLNAMDNMRLMVLGIDNNQVRIYEKRALHLEQSTDLSAYFLNQSAC